MRFGAIGAHLSAVAAALTGPAAASDIRMSRRRHQSPRESTHRAHERSDSSRALGCSSGRQRSDGSLAAQRGMVGAAGVSTVRANLRETRDELGALKLGREAQSSSSTEHA